jgi:hypothetical protein
LQIKTKIVSSHTADSKPVKLEVNGTVILLPLAFLAGTSMFICGNILFYQVEVSRPASQRERERDGGRRKDGRERWKGT